MSKINEHGTEITLLSKDKEKYISLTDIAKKKNSEEPRFVVINFLINRNTIEFLGVLEKIYNPNFNRVGFDTVRLKAGLNYFTISPSKWIEETNAIGIISKSGRYNRGTFAYEDIALEFASWISAEFKLYFIKEFRRLKYEENERNQKPNHSKLWGMFRSILGFWCLLLISRCKQRGMNPFANNQLGWDVKRILTKMNYKIHTDAIKHNLIPLTISKSDKIQIYTNEADVLNVALFGMTAKEWREKNVCKKGNIRDYANVSQLVYLANIESLNSLFIKEEIDQHNRLIKLNEIAISQMKILVGDNAIRKMEESKYLELKEMEFASLYA